MLKFKIEVTETLQRVIEIEADNQEQAFDIVHARYREEEIILNNDNHCDTEFTVIED